jgi:chromosome segregation ATPase
MKYDRKTPNLSEKWLQDLVEKVGYQFSVRKAKEILALEIPKETMEIEYIRDRIAASRKRIHETENAIKEIQHRLVEPKRKLARLQTERQSAVNEYARLEDGNRDLEDQLILLPEIQAEIRKLRAEVRRASRRLASLQSSNREVLDRKERLKEEVRSLNAKLMNIEGEISVMRDTRDILGGKRPEQFDPDTFETITEDVGVNVENYMNEMKGEIERIKKEISSSKVRLDEKKIEEETLLSQKEGHQETLEGLRAQIGEDDNSETLMTELDNLEKQKDSLKAILVETKEGIRATESAISSVDNRIRREIKIESDLKESHSYLNARKQEMANFSNVADEIQRLKNEAQRLEMESEVNGILREMIKKLNADMDPTKGQLLASLEKYRSVFSAFEGEINGLLSP